VSINSLFEISQRSFRALNAKMNATGQNIANSGSEGYSRRRATLEASNTVSPGLYTSPAQNNTPGDGASVASFERVRNKMLDQAAAEAQAGKEGAREEARILSRIEGTLATDTEGSLTSSLESFFSGFNDLANNPSDQGVRETVLAKAKGLTAEFNRLDQELGEVTSDTESALSNSVDAANGLIKEVANLNEKISQARASGTPDLAAKDRRDAAVKKLSGLVPVEAQEDAENGYTLSVDGMTVVQGKETTLLQTRSSPRKGSKQFPVEVTDANLDLNTDQGKEDAVTIGPGDFGPSEGADNLDQNLVEGDVGGQVGVEGPIKGQLGGDLEGGTYDIKVEDGVGVLDGNLQGGDFDFDIEVEDGDGANELDFTVTDSSGDVVTGGAQTVDVTKNEDITLKNGSSGDIKLNVSDGSGNGFEPDDVTGSEKKGFSVEVKDTGNDLKTSPGKEDAVEINAGDFTGSGDGADNLNDDSIGGDVKAPINENLLDFTVTDSSGDVVTGGTQTVDVSEDVDITLEEGSPSGPGDVKLDVSDGPSSGFAGDDVTAANQPQNFSVDVTDAGLDLNTDQGKEDAVEIKEGDFAGTNEGADNLDERLVEGDVEETEGDVKVQAGVEAPIKGELDGDLEGGSFDITVEDGDEAGELDFIVEDGSGNVVTGGAQTIDLSSGQNDLSSGDSDIILEEGSEGNLEIDPLDIEGFAPGDVLASKIPKSTVEFGDTGVAFEPGDEDAGKLGAQLRALNETLPEVQNQLDTLAEDVVAEVNSIHETGFDQNGETDSPFFDPAGTTADSIQKAVDLPEKIAAYGADGEPGDTTPAQNMADLSDTLTPKAIDLAANVGSKVQQAASREEAKAASAERQETLAAGVSDVSVDEEMSNLIEQQQQFAASARVLRTAQEVTSTLLSM